MTDTPVDIRDHAADNLRYIREAMERSSAFTIIPGKGIILIGVTALIAGVVAARQGDPRYWVATWLIELLVAIVIDIVSTRAKANRTGVMLGVPFRRFLVSFSVPLVTAGLLSLLFLDLGHYSYLPTLWLLLYGTAIVTGGAFSIRIVPIMGWAFIFLGVIALSLAPEGGDIMMGLGFGGLHITFGLIIARRYGG